MRSRWCIMGRNEQEEARGAGQARGERGTGGAKE